MQGVTRTIVVLLFVALVGVIVYGTGFFQEKMRDQQRVGLMKKITVALEAYRGEIGHYPRLGDEVLNGGVVPQNNSFKAMIVALGQRNILDSNSISDPSLGKLFGEFNGADEYQDGVKFVEKDSDCQGVFVRSQAGTTSDVVYSYFTQDDGKTYGMCLLKENGEVMTFVSPKELEDL